ncbi:hypothetical protein [Shewanella indica]|uniref:hypothetical protein n=1 Tax=Shewanella indica TaxID=768528 RepID=UPI00046F6095|nr:hypothetical protein [Shewanella indica]
MSNTNYLEPLAQLELLCKEIHSSLHKLTKPLLIVGGQSVSYWLKYYATEMEQNQLENVASADIDFMLTDKQSIGMLGAIWNVKIEFSGEDTIALSVAITELYDLKSNRIKSDNAGSLCIDFSKLQVDGEEKANFVDFIDKPAGYAAELGDSRRYLFTELYEFPKSADLAAHPNLLILNPIGCLKSRVSNIFMTSKPKELEVARIRALLYPIYFYFQDLYVDHDPKLVKKYLRALFEIIYSEHGVQLYCKYDLDLRDVLFHSWSLDGQKPAYYENELPRVIEKVNDKFDRRKQVYNQFLSRGSPLEEIK